MTVAGTVARLALARRIILAGALVTAGAVGTAPLDAQLPTGDQVCYVEPGQQCLVIGVVPSPSATAAPSESVGPTVSPSASPAATPTPTLAPTPTPTPPPSGSPAPTPVTCGTSLQSVVDAAPASSSIDLGGCTFTAGATITKPISISRGTIRQAGTALTIRANDVTVNGTVFDGGNQTIRIQADRTKLLGDVFVGMRETSIRLDPGADDTLIDGGSIVQSVVTGSTYSPIAANDNGAGVGTFKGLTIRGLSIDNGPGTVAHFGIEVWGVSGLLIDGITTKGAGAQISIPRSDGAVVRNSTFDLTSAFWGMELADVENAQVTGNIAFASGAINLNQQWRAFVQLHPGSGAVRNITITGNRLTNYPALLNAAGDQHTITGNCLASVPRLNWGSFAGANKAIANNGPCA